MNGIKSYANSYLYTKIPDYERNILEYVMKAERIDKHTETFSGIIDDVKRRQTTAVLSRVLMRDDVILAVHTKPLPASFKVFACKDVKTDKQVRVFIDCTGLISMKNGFLACPKIDVLCSYLLSAMTNIIYNNEPMRLTTNSSIIQSGAECFVALASHIFDYLRPNGYAENKNKIAYILAQYFQVSLLGLDRDDSSVKNLSAKIAEVPLANIRAMEIYYDDEALVNIHTLVTALAETFKMKGVGTDVFIEKWNWFYGVGCQFGTELFPAFASMISNAYCGAYVNNQKTIEKCCGRSMVDFTNALIRVGGDTLDKGFKYESSIDREVSRNKIAVNEVLFNKRITKEMQITVDDLNDDPGKLKKKIDTLAKEGFGDNKRNRSRNMKSIYLSAIGTVSREYLADVDVATKKYNNKMISTVVKAINPYLLTSEKDYVIKGLSQTIVNLSKTTGKNPNIALVKADVKVALKAIDPSNAMLKESVVSEGLLGQKIDFDVCADESSAKSLIKDKADKAKSKEKLSKELSSLILSYADTVIRDYSKYVKGGYKGEYRRYNRNITNLAKACRPYLMQEDKKKLYKSLENKSGKLWFNTATSQVKNGMGDNMSKDTRVIFDDITSAKNLFKNSLKESTNYDLSYGRKDSNFAFNLLENTMFSPSHYQKKLPDDGKFKIVDLFNMEASGIKRTISKSMSYVEDPKIKSNYALSIIKDSMSLSGKGTIDNIRSSKAMNSIWTACRKYLLDKDVDAAQKIMKINQTKDKININVKVL